MKVSEISFYVKAEFLEWMKSQHCLFFLFDFSSTDKLPANDFSPTLSKFTVGLTAV